MPFRRDIFAINYQTVNTPIDLRAEFDIIVFGNANNPRYGTPHLIRHMRRDSDGNKIACVCLDELTKDCDPDCSYCYGEGYLWDESWYIARSQYLGSDGGLGSRFRITEPGEIRNDTKLFFFRYDTPIKYGDKIVEVKLDEEGEYVSPLVRTAIYKPQTINALRGKNGRIEFYSIYCLEKDAIRSDTL